MTKMHIDAADETTPTMAELIQHLLADRDLTEARRRNLASSIRRFCTVLGLAPEQAPAAFSFFRERLEGFHPADADMKAHRWQTIRSDVAFALKRIGLAPNQPKPRVPPSDAWTEVRARIQAVGNRWTLARFVRFCDERGIQPSAVDDEAVAVYDAFIRTQTFKIKPGRHLRDTCLLWNRLAGMAPDLQLQSVTLPCNRLIYTMPWEALPASIRAGPTRSWYRCPKRAISEGPPRPLRPASVKAYRFALRRRSPACCIVAGLSTIDSLGALVAPAAAPAALQFHIDRTGNKPSQNLAQIAHVLVLVALHAVGADDQVVARLKRYRANLSPRRRPEAPAARGTPPVH